VLLLRNDILEVFQDYCIEIAVTYEPLNREINDIALQNLLQNVIPMNRLVVAVEILNLLLNTHIIL